MDLQEFFEAFGVNMTAASRLIDVSPQHLRAILSGTVKPSNRLARDIERYSRGIVTVTEILQIRDRYLKNQIIEQTDEKTAD